MEQPRCDVLVFSTVLAIVVVVVESWMKQLYSQLQDMDHNGHTWIAPIPLACILLLSWMACPWWWMSSMDGLESGCCCC